MQAILGINGANKRQVLKQPDVLMLLYLMRQSQVFQRRSTEEELGLHTHRALTYLWLVPGSSDSRDLSLGFGQSRKLGTCKRHWWIWRICAAILLMGFTELLPVVCGRRWFSGSAVSTDGTGPVVTPHLPLVGRACTSRFTGAAIGTSLICALVRTSGESFSTWMAFSQIRQNSTTELGRGSQMKRACPLIGRLTKRCRVYLEGNR